MLRATARQPWRARRASWAWRAGLAAGLACALLLFTTVYRHSRSFSPAIAARIHALSADHTDARTLFGGASGPLVAIAVAAGISPAPRPRAPYRVESQPEAGTATLLALASSPRSRPPPTAL